MSVRGSNALGPLQRPDGSRLQVRCARPVRAAWTMSVTSVQLTVDEPARIDATLVFSFRDGDDVRTMLANEVTIVFAYGTRPDGGYSTVALLTLDHAFLAEHHLLHLPWAARAGAAVRQLARPPRQQHLRWPPM